MEKGANLLDHKITACDHKLCTVYVDHIHHNVGTHLTGVIANDSLWQKRWKRIINLAPRLYDAPKGKAGLRFVRLFTEEIQGSQERRWNSERPMVFIGKVLAKIPGIKASKDIRVRILRRVDQWAAKAIGALV